MGKQAGKLFPEVAIALLEVMVELENFDLTPAHIGQAGPDIVFEVRHCH